MQKLTLQYFESILRKKYSRKAFQFRQNVALIFMLRFWELAPTIDFYFSKKHNPKLFIISNKGKGKCSTIFLLRNNL